MKLTMPERNEAVERSLHPEFREHLDVLFEIVEMAIELDPEPEQLNAHIREDADWSRAWDWAMDMVRNNRVACLGGSAYAVPFLDPSVCLKLKARAEALGEAAGWKPNELEGDAYQIPEIVVEHHDPRLHRILAAQAKYLDLWHLILYQTVPQSISSIQFTKYSPENTSKGNWHHDRDSDYTVVVSLDPESFTGGGTDLRMTPTEYIGLKPLPAGWAMLMNGRQLQHRGRPVESGERHLLTFWLDSRPVA